MKIYKYRLNEDGTIPGWVSNGGYFPHDGLLIGAVSVDDTVPGSHTPLTVRDVVSITGLEQDEVEVTLDHIGITTFISVKNDRNKLLKESDYRDLPSYPGTDQTAWRTYRQKLRDIPQDFTNVEDVVWPTKPTEGH